MILYPIKGTDYVYGLWQLLKLWKAIGRIWGHFNTYKKIPNFVQWNAKDIIHATLGFNPQVFLLNYIKNIKPSLKVLISNLLVAVTILFTKYWKKAKIPTASEWDTVLLDKFTIVNKCLLHFQPVKEFNEIQAFGSVQSFHRQKTY